MNFSDDCVMDDLKLSGEMSGSYAWYLPVGDGGDVLFCC